MHYPLFLMHTDASPEKHRKAQCSQSSMAFLHPAISSNLLATGYRVHQKAGWRKAARALEWSSSLSSPACNPCEASFQKSTPCHDTFGNGGGRRAKTKKGRPLHKMNYVCTNDKRGYVGCSMMLYGSARRLYRLDAQVTCRVFQCTGMKVHLEGSKQQGYYVWLRWSLRNTTWFKGDHKVVRNCFICTIPQQDQTCETLSEDLILIGLSRSGKTPLAYWPQHCLRQSSCKIPSLESKLVLGNFQVSELHAWKTIAYMRIWRVWRISLTIRMPHLMLLKLAKLPGSSWPKEASRLPTTLWSLMKIHPNSCSTLLCSCLDLQWERGEKLAIPGEKVFL